MFHLPRSLIRQLRSILKNAFTGRERTTGWVCFQATATGLRIQAASPDVAISYRDTMSHQAAEFAAPLDLLTACEGKTDDAVAFEAAVDGSVRAHWDDRGIPQQRSCEKPPKKLLPFIADPETTVSNEPGLLNGLIEAAATTDPNSSRFALGCICLRGSSGSLATTDGRQLLVQSGWQLPWQEDLLIPGSAAFACRDLPQDLPVEVGLAGEGISFLIGPWSIWLRINKDGRFPKVDSLVRKPEAAKSHLTIDKRDAAFAVDALKRLPIWSDSSHPITLDLNGEVVIRAQADKATTPTELLLARSSLTGDAVRLVANGEQLGRALAMGFTDIYLYGAESVTIASDSRRHYLWMPFEPGGAVQPHADACRISSLDFTAVSRPQRPTPVAAAVTPSVAKEPSIPMKTTPETDKSESRQSPIEQAVTLRNTLRDAANKTNELVRSLKRQKRQSKLVESTLASLKELQRVA